MQRNENFLSDAIAIASTAHREQYDKGGKPYILHPLFVMQSLNTTDQELMAIAVLHDVVEDTPVTFEDLVASGFSARVVNAVRALTKIQNENTQDYMARIKQNPDAIKVKMQDLLHNSDLRRLKGTTNKDIARMQKYMEMYTELKNLSEQTH